MAIERRFLDVSLTILGILNQPAENPSAGDQYIVGANGTGAFEGIAPNSVARFDGTQWKFSAPRAGTIEALDASAGTILRFNGSSWNVVADFNSFIAPVLDIVNSGNELPATCSENQVFLNIDDNKLYTATDVNTWNSGVALTDGTRYASATDFKVYESNGSVVTPAEIKDGGLFLNKADGCIYVYDEAAHEFKRNGADVTVTEIHHLTAAEVSAKSFSLSNSIASGRENQVMLSVGGVAQIVGIDFSASGNSISWNNKGLDSLGLAAGDTFIVHYVKA